MLKDSSSLKNTMKLKRTTAFNVTQRRQKYKALVDLYEYQQVKVSLCILYQADRTTVLKNALAAMQERQYEAIEA